MGRNRSRKRNIRTRKSSQIDSTSPNVILSTHLTRSQSKRRGKQLRNKRKKKESKKEELILADGTSPQKIINSTVIWEYFVPGKNSWSPYDQAQQDIFERARVHGVNAVSFVQDQIKHVACFQKMQQRRLTEPSTYSDVCLRRRIEGGRTTDTSLATMSMEWLSTVPKKYENLVSVYEIIQEQSNNTSKETSRAKIEYSFACSHFTRLLNRESHSSYGAQYPLGWATVSNSYTVTQVDSIVYDSEALPYHNYNLLKKQFVKRSFTKEILVFHGTTKDVIPLIIKEG